MFWCLNSLKRIRLVPEFSFAPNSSFDLSPKKKKNQLDLNLYLRQISPFLELTKLVLLFSPKKLIQIFLKISSRTNLDLVRKFNN